MSTPGELVHEQLERYKRCHQCKRKTNNVGETNIWCDTVYIPGSRYICWPNITSRFASLLLGCNVFLFLSFCELFFCLENEKVVPFFIFSGVFREKHFYVCDRNRASHLCHFLLLLSTVPFCPISVLREKCLKECLTSLRLLQLFNSTQFYFFVPWVCWWIVVPFWTNRSLRCPHLCDFSLQAIRSNECSLTRCEQYSTIFKILLFCFILIGIISCKKLSIVTEWNLRKIYYQRDGEAQ